MKDDEMVKEMMMNNDEGNDVRRDDDVKHMSRLKQKV